MRWIISLPVLLVLCPAHMGASDRNRGPFKPVVARQTLTYISEDMQGGEKVLYQFTGSYLRSSNGSELATLGLTVNGVEGRPSEARLRIAKDGATYKLDYAKHTATLMATQSLPLMPHSYDRVKKEDVIGHRNINGLHCIGITVMDHGEETGTAWRDLKQDILVRLISFFGSKEDHVKVVLERSEISTRQEPDESLFALTGQWTIIAPASANGTAPSQTPPSEAAPK